MRRRKEPLAQGQGDIQAMNQQRTVQRMLFAVKHPRRNQRVRIDIGHTQHFAAMRHDLHLLPRRERGQRRRRGIDLVAVNPGVTQAQAAIFILF